MGSIDFGKARYHDELIASQVCRIEIDLHPTEGGREQGTGFLIAPDLILTNYHVVQHLFDVENRQESQQKWALAEDVSVFFDRVTQKGGTEIAPGVRCILAEDWLVSWSKNSLMDQYSEPKLDSPGEDELDYAILRLATPIGLERIYSETEPRERGWIAVPEGSYAYSQGEEIAIFQYPVGQPLHKATGILLPEALNENRTRVRYKVSGDYGASGAPCVNRQWQLVAVHRARQHEDGREDLREGIPISAILNRQERLGKPLWRLIEESRRAAKAARVDHDRSPPIDTGDLINQVYERFDRVPQRVLQNLLDEVRQSNRPTAIFNFHVWLQQLLRLRTQPEHQTWVFLCLEFHLGVNNMNYDSPAFGSYSPLHTVRFIHSVTDSLKSQVDRLQTLEPDIRHAPPHIQLNSVTDALHVVESIRHELFQTLGFFTRYNLMVAAEVAESNQLLLKCLNRLSSGLRQSSSYSPMQRARGTAAIYQISDNLNQLGELMENLMTWLKGLASEADRNLRTVFSNN